MGRFIMFLGLLSGWAMFIFDLPRYVEAASKWLPILSGVDAWLKSSSRAFADAMPPISNDASQMSILTTPAGLTGFLVGAALVAIVAVGAFVFSPVAMRMGNILRIGIGALTFVILICLYLSSSVMLHTMDGVPLGQALLLYGVGGKLSTATDPSYLYYGSMVYSSFAVVSGVVLLALIAVLWRAAQRSRRATND
jgi:hypothetical protein